jgi:hypothetical protein
MNNHEKALLVAACIFSGTLATLTGKQTYAELDVIQADFIAFVEQHPGQYEMWVQAWQVFREKARGINESGPEDGAAFVDQSFSLHSGQPEQPQKS